MSRHPLTPRALRDAARNSHELVAGLSAEEALVLADALEIADCNSRVILRSELTPTEAKGPEAMHWWLDESSADTHAKDAIEQAVRYLTARDLLNRHPVHPHWICPRWPEQPTQETHQT